jgi:hypothetical protein
MTQLITIQVEPDINQTLTNLLAESWCHRIELTSAATLALWEALIWSIAMPLAGASN